MENKSLLKKLLSHIWINKAGVGSSVYPNSEKELARLRVIQRKKDIRPEEVEQMKPDIISLKNICEELLARTNGP